jgi:dihydropyrimidinase
MDLVIRNGTLVGPGFVAVTDIGVDGGRIVQLGARLGRGAEDVDATGKLVLPGVVDPHVHLLDLTVAGTVSDTQVDDIYHGSRAAAAGGVTTVCDFAYQRRGETLQSAIDSASSEAAGKSWIDFSFHSWVSDPSEQARDEVRTLASHGFPSFKLWMALEGFDERLVEYLRFMEEVRAHEGLVVIHCEDRALMDFCTERLIEDGDVDVRRYPESKPPSVEVSATARAVEMLRITGARGYIVHVSCAEALEVTRRGRASGLPILVETRPLYLYLTEERYREDRHLGVKYVGVPPLREQSDVDALWAGLAAQDIDTVATDHVGWSLKQKLASTSIPTIASGVQALETTLALLYSYGVRPGRISLTRWVELLSTSPAKVLGAFPRKGTLSPDADADLVIFDPDREVTIAADELHGGTDFDPYEGFHVKGWVETTYLRGSRVFDRGEFLGSPSGRLVPRLPNAQPRS